MIQRNYQQLESLSFFQIPELADHNTTLIGVLDASGSMRSKWPFLVRHYNILKNKMKQAWTITFDSRPYFCFQKDLQSDLSIYGGGETNIVAAFEHLNDLLDFIPQKENITVLFVSDGKDSVQGIEQRLLNLKPKKVKNLNFICLGIGKDFPTFIAMKLRAIYHTGDQTVLPLFIIKGKGKKPTTHYDIEEAIEKMFKKEFENINQQCRHKMLFEVSPLLKFPWDEELSTQVWSGSWVLANEDKKVTIENYQIIDPIMPNRAQILQIGQYWLKSLQLMAFQRSVIKEARVALRTFNTLINSARCTFAERLQMQEEILDISNELQQMAEEDVLAKLNEEQAAERMLIGTKVGKFYKKIMKKRVMSAGEFEEYRNLLIEQIEKNQFLDTETERSVITLQNQKEILQEKDLIEGLQICPTQFHFVISFPLIGYGLQVYRSDSVQVEPYNIDVQSIAKHHKYVDSVTIIQSPNQELVLSVGDGDQETINCILPLYRKSDKDLRPFLKSKLFEILMTYMVAKNADAILTTSYTALLANTLYYLIKQERSQYQMEMIDLLVESYELVHLEDERYQFHTQNLLDFPKETMADQNNLKNTRCEDLTKPILILSSLRKNLPIEKVKEILDCIVREAIGRMLKYVSQETFYSIFFAIQNNIKDYISDLGKRAGFKFNPNDLYNDKYNVKFLREAIDQLVNLEQLMHQPNVYIEFQVENLRLAIYKSKYSLESLQKGYNHFLGVDMSVDLLISSVFHARIKSSLERAHTPVITDTNRIMKQEIFQMYIKECIIPEAQTLAFVVVKERYPELFRARIVEDDYNQFKQYHSNPPGQGKGRRRRRRPKRIFG